MHQGGNQGTIILYSPSIWVASYLIEPVQYDAYQGTRQPHCVIPTKQFDEKTVGAQKSINQTVATEGTVRIYRN